LKIASGGGDCRVDERAAQRASSSYDAQPQFPSATAAAALDEAVPPRHMDEVACLRRHLTDGAMAGHDHRRAPALQSLRDPGRRSPVRSI